MHTKTLHSKQPEKRRSKQTLQVVAEAVELDLKTNKQKLN